MLSEKPSQHKLILPLFELESPKWEVCVLQEKYRILTQHTSCKTLHVVLNCSSQQTEHIKHFNLIILYLKDTSVVMRLTSSSVCCSLTPAAVGS